MFGLVELFARQCEGGRAGRLRVMFGLVTVCA
jgi:hypothetical protein